MHPRFGGHRHDEETWQLGLAGSWVLSGVSDILPARSCAVAQCLERVKGIEPSYEAWEAAVLPLNYTRIL